MKPGLAVEFGTTPRIALGDGVFAELPSILNGWASRHVMVVTDPGLVKAGLVEPVIALLRRAGFAVTIYDGVEADPPERLVIEAAEAARLGGIDSVLGLGGGSAMDTAKLVAYLARNPGELDSIYGVDLARGRRLPLILAPTTAGTGSEVTPIAIVTTEADEKKGVVSRQLLPDVALLDPLATLGLSPESTAATGIDAMVHAIEAYTSKIHKNPISDALAVQALRLLSFNFPLVLRSPHDVEARGAMLLGSCLAGMAFANAPVGAVHALAYPLGGRYHVPHGHSNAIMLGPVLRFNLAVAAPLYAELAAAVGAEPGCANAFVETMVRLVESSGLSLRLRDVGVTANSVDLLATDAMKQTRLLVNNPSMPTEEDVRRLYEEIF